MKNIYKNPFFCDNLHAILAVHFIMPFKIE